MVILGEIVDPTVVGTAETATATGASAGEPEKRRGIAMIAGMVVLVVAAFGAMIWLTATPERRELVERLVESPLGLFVLFGLAALSTATLLLPTPGLALTAIAGAAGDPLVVGVVAGLGQAVGELTGYFAGRGGRSFVPDTPAIARVTRWLERRGVVTVFVLALIPNPLFDIAGIAAGALRMSAWRYLSAAAAGKVIKNVLVASGASSIGVLVGFLMTTSSGAR